MQRWIRSYIKLSIAHCLPLVAAGLLITAIALLGIFRLRLSTNFAKLLPQDTPSVKASREISAKVGSTDFLVVAVESPHPANNIAALEKLGPRLKKHPDLGFVLWKVDTRFFTRHGLLYLDITALKRLHQALKEKISQKTQESMGLFVDLDDPGSKTERDRCLPAHQDDLDLLIKRFRRRGSPSEIGFYRAKKKSAGVDLSGYLTTPDGKVAVLLAKPTRESLSLGFVRRIVKKTQQEIAAVQSETAFPQMRIEVGGAYRNRIREYAAILTDVKKSGLVSALLIALVAALMFRRLRPIPLIFVPLLCGVAWTLGVISLTPLRELNVITAFIVGILLGLGIDFGVHLTARYLQERADGATLERALQACLEKTGRAILASAVTTAAALLILTISDFKGFSEFGVVAGIGVLLCLAAFFLLFPGLAALLERIAPPKQWKPFLAVRSGSTKTRASRFPYGSAIVLLLAAGFTAYSLYRAPDLKFEYNFRNLRGKKTKTSIRYGDAMGNRASPSVALAPDRESAVEFFEILQQRNASAVGDPHIKDFMALDHFIPEQQTKKLQILTSIRSLLEKALRDTPRTNHQRRRSLKRALEMASVQRVTVDRLPSWLTDQFRYKSDSSEKKGKAGRFLLIYPAGSLWHAQEVERFKKAYNRVTLPSGKKVFVASSSFVLVDVIRAVQKDTRRMLILAAVLVLLVLLIDVRNPLRALLVFTPLACGLIWMVGVLALTYERLSLYNMVVISTIVGAGIDASVHLYHSFLEKGGARLKQVILRTGLAVTTASVTTGVGFAGMMLSHHAGLASIGRLAVIGLSTCLLSALCVLPALMALGNWWKKRKNPPSDPEPTPTSNVP
jgi:hypothetical protein